MQIPETIIANIYKHIIEVYNNPFSLFFNLLVIIFLIIFLIAIYSKRVRIFLIKIKLLEEKENPKGFLYLLSTIYIIMKIIQIFIFQIFVVDGPSMMPTLQTGNILIVDKLSSIKQNTSNNFQRGSVVVFNFKKEGDFANGRYLVKRIIGIPGDTIIIQNNKVKIITSGGETIYPEESFIKYNKKYVPDVYVTLTTNQYFFMGDNRDESYDSRYFGPINKQDISGEAIFMLYPNPSYFPGKVTTYK